MTLLSPLKVVLVSLFPSHLFPSIFTFRVEEAASCRRDRLSKSILSKPKLDHPNLGENIQWYHTSHATIVPFQKFQIFSGKKCWNKFVGVHEISLHNPKNFQNQIQKTLRETKKTNGYVNSVILSFCDTTYVGFVFFISLSAF
jgi:hypothetical protein